MSKKLIGTTGLLIILVLLISINMVSNATLRGAKVDLTEGKLYTLTQGTKNILKALDEPITLRFYYSEKLASNNPAISDYGKRVGELLQEYAVISGGKVKLDVIDPEPFSEAEEKAVRAGMQGAPLSRSERLYFGLEGTNSTDGKQTIPFFMPDKEEFLEYDVTSLIYGLAHPEKKKLTIVTGLPIDGGGDPMARMMGQDSGSEPWYLYQQLQQSYDVRKVELTANEIPKDTDVLLVIHPKDMLDAMKYSIDQYVLGGGKAIIFTDPVAEVDKGTPNPNNPMQAMMQPKNSNLPELFKAWGIEMVEGKIAADRKRAVEVTAGSQNRPEVVPFVFYQSVDKEGINREEYTTSQLETITLGMPGVLKKLADGKTDVIPLIETSTDAAEMDASKGQMFPNPKEILSEFKSEDKKLMMAARITGKVSTAYPDGPKEGAKSESHLSESKEPINVIVVADVDMLTDRFWVQVQNFFGQKIARLTANNADMVVNFIDFFGGSKDLISIRGRGKFQRPFSLVAKLEEEARDKSSSKIKELEDKLKETETKLQELQSKKPDGNNRLIVSDEQQKEIEKFELQQIEANRELRRVQLSLRQDIEKLGQWLKFVNIGLIPILVGIFAVGLGTAKSRRRRRK